MAKQWPADPGPRTQPNDPPLVALIRVASPASAPGLPVYRLGRRYIAYVRMGAEQQAAATSVA